MEKICFFILCYIPVLMGYSQIQKSVNFSDTIFGLDIEMVFVPGGTFSMGNDDGEKDENPVHSVTLTSFFIGKTEVTQRQWRTVMGDNPSFFLECDNCPVEQVSWHDVRAFIEKLNRITGKTYRLPTEAEWEYAARGGITGKGYIYSGSDNIGEVAFYTKNSGSKTHPVGEKQPNELGLLDMSGNLLEWCSDWYGAYSSSQQTNPKGARSGTNRVFRGGSWASHSRHCRSTNRGDDDPDSRGANMGFRLVFVQ